MHFRFARAGRMLAFSFNFEGMLERGFRVKAARRRGKAEALVFCFSRGPCIPRTATVHYMPGIQPVNHKSCMRVRSVSAHELPYCPVKQKTPWHACAAL